MKASKLYSLIHHLKILLLSLNHKYLLIEVLITQSKTNFHHTTDATARSFKNSFQETAPADRKWAEIFGR